MRKLFLITLLIVILVGGGWWFTYWWTESRHWEATDNASTQANITVISAKVPGIVERVDVHTNQAVKAGDILISLYKNTFNASVAREAAVVAGAKASLAGLETKQVLQDALVEAGAAEVRVAQAELERARGDLARAKQLKSRGFTELQRYDHALTDVASAAAELTRTQATLGAVRAEKGVLSAEAVEVSAIQAEAEAELRLAQIALKLSDIRAPQDGVVGNKNVEPGEYIQVGARKMALVALDDIWVNANFKETQLTGILAGQKARVTVDAFPDETIDGIVDSLSPASGAQFSLLPADNATGNFTKIVQRVPVKIVLDRDNPVLKRLRPGMSVTAKVDTRGKHNDSLSAQ